MEPLSQDELACVTGCLSVVGKDCPDRRMRSDADTILEQIRWEGGIEGLSDGSLGRVCLALALTREALRGQKTLTAGERVQMTEAINCLVAKLRRALPDWVKTVLDEEDMA